MNHDFSHHVTYEHDPLHNLQYIHPFTNPWQSALTI